MVHRVHPLRAGRRVALQPPAQQREERASHGAGQNRRRHGGRGAGCVAFGFGSVAVMNAALASGFIFPGVIQRIVAAEGSNGARIIYFAQAGWLAWLGLALSLAGRESPATSQ